MTARALVALMIVAAVVRALFLVADPHPAKLAGLAAGEGEVARNIVDHGEWLVIDKRALRRVDRLQAQASTLLDPSSFDYSRYDAQPRRVPELVKPLGPALILAGLWKATGDQRYIWLQLLQLVVGVCLTAVIAWLSLALFDRARAAVAAAGLWAVSPTLSYLGVLPLYEIWAVFTMLAVVALYVLVRRRGSPAAGLLAIGLTIGVGTLFRQGILLLAPALALAELGLSGRQALRTGALLGLGCLVALIPWTARNLSEFGELRPTNGVGGQVLWEALGEDTASFGAVRDDRITLRMVHASRPDLEYGTPAYDSHLLSKALGAIADRPFAYAQLVVRRAAKGSLLNVPQPDAAVESWEDSDRRPIAFVVDRPLAAAQLAVAALFDPLLFVGAVIATIVLWRRKQRELLLLWLAWGSVLVVPVLVSGSHPRYVAPGLPFLMILSGLAVDMAIARARAAWRRRSGPSLSDAHRSAVP